MSIYIAHHRKNNASNALDVPSTVQKRLQCTTKTVNLHVRLTQVVSEQVPCRWSSDSEGATAVRIELKPWNNE